jgi:hypothetical protein
MDQESTAAAIRPWQCVNRNIRYFINERRAFKESIIRLAQLATAEMRGDAAIQLRRPVHKGYQALLSTIAAIENRKKIAQGLS